MTNFPFAFVAVPFEPFFSLTVAPMTGSLLLLSITVPYIVISSGPVPWAYPLLLNERNAINHTIALSFNKVLCIGITIILVSEYI